MTDIFLRLIHNLNNDELAYLNTLIEHEVERRNKRPDRPYTGKELESVGEFLSSTTVVHPIRGLIPLEPYEYQAKTALTLEETERQLVLINTARQMGITTIICGYLLYEAIKNPNRTIIHASSSFHTACEGLERIRHMLEGTTAVIPAFKRYNKGEMEFANGSRIKAMSTQQMIDGLRGFTSHIIHIDNAAFISHKSGDSLYASIMPSLAATGGKMIMSSCPSGEPAGLFYDLWNNEKVDAERICLPWHLVPGRDEEWIKPLRDVLGEKMFRQEFECQWPEAED